MKRIDKFIFHLFFGLSSWHILSMRVALVKDAAQFLAYFFTNEGVSGINPKVTKKMLR